MRTRHSAMRITYRVVLAAALGLTGCTINQTIQGNKDAEARIALKGSELAELRRVNAGLISQRDALRADLQRSTFIMEEQEARLTQLLQANAAARTLNDDQRKEKTQLDARARALREQIREIKAQDEKNKRENLALSVREGFVRQKTEEMRVQIKAWLELADKASYAPPAASASTGDRGTAK